jgi:dTDP-6-deoxy-L-talose 4-dehydrogenase (NAD+)
MYGDGQHPKSLIAQLNQALDQGLDEFVMSGGEQLRDFLPVEEVVARLTALVERSEVSGIINICSGSPVSVRTLVESILNSKGREIKLRLGFYPYSNFEPMAFWGNSQKIDSIFDSEEFYGGAK